MKRRDGKVEAGPGGAPGCFLILGAGAIGSVFGGMLARGGNLVTLVGRAAHMDAVRRSGLRIEGLLGEHLVVGLEAVTHLEEVKREPPFDAVLLCVKSCDTQEAASQLASSALVGPTTTVVSLQNGLGNVETLQSFFGTGNTLGGRVIFGAEVKAPGSVLVSVWADRVLLGGRNMEAARDLAREFTRCGIETSAVDDIMGALWGKVLYNAGLNPLSALLEVPYGRLGEQKDARAMLVEMISEAFSVAASETRLPWSDVDGYLELFFGSLLPSTAAHHSSMLQDILRGRRTEIEAINGEVIRRGRKNGVATPVNEVVYRLVKAKEGMGGADGAKGRRGGT